jgi:subtilisin family serine protease
VRFKQATAAASVAVVAAAAVAAVPSHAAASQPAASPKKAGASAEPVTRTITLITGDSVRVDPAGRVIGVRRAPGRDRVTLSVRRAGGRTSVIPDDAAALVNAGTLDPALFDVTGLLAADYDDAHRASLPLIVAYDRTTQRARAKSSVAAAGAVVKTSLPVINSDAVSEPKSQATKVWAALRRPGSDSSPAKVSAGIARVWLDRKVTASLDRSVPQIGAPDAWKAGFDGKGVKVAVLDTGVDRTHPDLADRVVAEKNFSDADNVDDHVGHGTHVASTIAGSGAASQGRYRGVAPGATIISGKVLDDNGGGAISGIVAGMSWAAEQGAKVVNLSLGGEDSPGIDPGEAAVNALTDSKGILFAVAAGNAGPKPQTIGSPGSATGALTVGAVDRQDNIAPFSSVGPTVDGAAKPDVTAPGVGIVAARAAHGTIGTPAGTGYVSMSGTSMATPHVAGAAAILAQQHPGMSGQQIKQILMISATPTPGLSPAQQGSGRVNLTKAITQKLTNTSASVVFAQASWPHNDDKPVTKTITYQNAGTEPATVDLAVQSSAPSGMFTLGSSRITVPAAGSASVDLTADTRVGTADGVFTAAVVATSGSVVLRTAVYANREVESYNLTIVERDNAGKAAEASIFLSSRHGDAQSLSTEPGVGTVTVRVPKDDYTVDSTIFTGTGGKRATSWLVQPTLSLTRDLTVHYAGRDAKPVRITAPGKATIRGVQVGYSALRAGTDSADGSSLDLASLERFTLGNVGKTNPGFTAEIAGTWATGNTLYGLMYGRTGSLFTGFAHTVSRAELATVQVALGLPTTAAKKGSLDLRWSSPTFGGSIHPGVTVNLPGPVQAYVTTASGAKWGFDFNQLDAEGFGAYTSHSLYRRYEAKRTYSATMNVGVFGPSAAPHSFGFVSTRMGNTMSLCIPLFTDGAGNQGDSGGTKATTTITIDGKPLEFPRPLPTPCKGLITDLPARSATYQISSDFTRDSSIANVSTRVTSAWTFTSAQAPAAGTALPLSTLRFTPALALDSSAKAGKVLTVPLVIEGAAAGKGLAAISVDVSYNGGTTWQREKVYTSNGKRQLRLNQPKTAKSVSLRATLKDTHANTHTVTIIKAYLLK